MVTSEWKRDRELIAFFVAPLVVPLITALYFGEALANNIGFLILIVTIWVAYGGTLVLGLPLYLLLRRLNATAFVFAPISGGVIGAATARLVWFVFGLDRPQDALGFGGLIGAAVGTVLWLIARPDLPRPRRGAEGAQ